ncbi:RagB/SusD family nutrient uptake outer membrane protein [Terrimonas rubra]|uniref:RagB/SusD family nutrient uptake outer membrane protein n=1 Tax=Terrimonas rubra TaxID=1035890 RepID=A0ABW6A5B5_9BACT
MNKKNILATALIAMVIFITSCSKSFLDVPPTNQGDANDFIKTAADAKIAINGISRKMISSSYYGRTFVLYGDAKGGDLTVFSQGRGLDNLYTFNHAPTSGSYGDIWSTLYDILLQINSLLQNIDKLISNGSTENFDVYKGQALTLRALIYFDLVRLYGEPYNENKSAYGVSNITTPIPVFSQPLRNTVEENYTQIIKDLTDAAPLLPKTKLNGYINYYGNKAILARVNLYMGNNAGALTAAEEVIGATSLYSLYSNANWVNSWKAQYGSESIFELAVLPTTGGDLGNASLGAYLRAQGRGGAAILGWFGASDYYLDRLKQDATDVRWGVMGPDERSTTPNPRLGACYKYSGGTDLSGDGKGVSTAVNIKVIRLSEMYLIAAEAALPTNKLKASNYLNEIRKRAPALTPSTETTVTLDMIIDEKSKELFGEGHRFFDMIRLNRSITFNDEYIGAAITHRAKTIDRTFFKTILPIAQSEINANPGLKAQQNPNYQ